MLGRIHLGSREKLTLFYMRSFQGSLGSFLILYSQYIVKSTLPEPDQFFFYATVIMRVFLTKAEEEVELCSESIIV